MGIWNGNVKAGVLLVTALMVLLAACQPVVANNRTSLTPQGTLEVIQNRGTLVIATEADYPPQSQRVIQEVRSADTRCDTSAYTANQFSGFDTDVAKEVAKRLGVEACFVTPPWSQLVAGNWADLWDISIGSMVITSDRMKRLYFTQPYTSGQAVLFVHKDNEEFKEPADLAGKRIGVCVGCAYESYLRGTLVIPGQQIDFMIDRAVVAGYDTDSTALDALAKGDGVHLDAVLTDPDSGKAAIDSGMPLKQLDGPLYYDFVSAAIDKKGSNSILLARRVSEIIQEMHKDGTLLALSEKYYGGDFTTPAAEFDIRKLNQLDE